MGRGFRSHRHVFLAFLAGGSIAVTVVAFALLVMFWGWLSNGQSGSTTIGTSPWSWQVWSHCRWQHGAASWQIDRQ